MLIKFLGATEADDQTVEVPEVAEAVEIDFTPPVEDNTSMWPAVFVICFIGVCMVAMTYLITRG